MNELIQYVRDITPAPLDIAQTRGLWDRLIAVMRQWWDRVTTADSEGAGWADGSGAGKGKSLLISACTSIISAVGLDNHMRVSWRINGDWKVYPYARKEYQEIGNAHNQVIAELYKENPILLNGGSSITSSSVYNMVDRKVKSLGYSNNLSVLERTDLMLLMDEVRRAQTASEVTNIFLSKSPGMRQEYSFLREYIDAMLVLDGKAEQIAFTEQIYSKIDSLTALTTTQKNKLKTMVSVALCSANLWVPVE